MADVTRKTTKTGQTMAFVTLSDIYGSVELIVFPRDYEKYKTMFTDDEKLLVKGKVSEDERGVKLICSKVDRLSDIPRKLWIRFKNKVEFDENQKYIEDLIRKSDGKSVVTVYLEEERQMKDYPRNMTVDVSDGIVDLLKEKFGEEQIKVTF